LAGRLQQTVELVAERDEFADAVVDVAQLAAHGVDDVVAGLFATFPQLKDVSDVVKAQSETLGGADELEPVDVLVGVVAVAGRCTGRGRDQPDTTRSSGSSWC
jgi:hypothetical protein